MNRFRNIFDKIIKADDYTKMKYRIFLLFLLSVVGFMIGSYSMNEGLRLLAESGVSITILKAIFGAIFSFFGTGMMIYFVIKPLVVVTRMGIQDMNTDVIKK